MWIVSCEQALVSVWRFGYQVTWTLSKADTSLKRTVALVPRVSALERVDCIPNCPGSVWRFGYQVTWTLSKADTSPKRPLSSFVAEGVRFRESWLNQISWGFQNACSGFSDWYWKSWQVSSWEEEGGETFSPKAARRPRECRGGAGESREASSWGQGV